MNTFANELFHCINLVLKFGMDGITRYELS